MVLLSMSSAPDTDRHRRYRGSPRSCRARSRLAWSRVAMIRAGAVCRSVRQQAPYSLQL